MKPLICPQCGGSITEYSPTQDFAVCNYCTTRFLIQRDAPKPVVQPVYNYPAQPSTNPNVFLITLVAFGLVFGAVILLAVSLRNKSTSGDGTTSPPRPSYPTPTPRAIASPTPNPNLLEFGAKGVDNGRFQEADAISVDSKGRIYVGDGTLRVQQFDEKGVYLKTWQIPSETRVYRRARGIQKILMDDKDQLHVLVGGVVLIYKNDSTEPFKSVHFAPDFIQDFALRSDGGRLFVVNDGNIETLFHISPSGKTLRKIVGFHTDTALAALSPRETGIAAIRLATDGAGNIFSVYAFGDLGSYQLQYDPKDLMIFRFSPEGKYVNKFAQSVNSCGIEIDNQGRIYVSESNSIWIYTDNGIPVTSVKDLGQIDAFALDKQNNIYVLKDDLVFKRPAVN